MRPARLVRLFRALPDMPFARSSCDVIAENEPIMPVILPRLPVKLLKSPLPSILLKLPKLPKLPRLPNPPAMPLKLDIKVVSKPTEEAIMELMVIVTDDRLSSCDCACLATSSLLRLKSPQLISAPELDALASTFVSPLFTALAQSFSAETCPYKLLNVVLRFSSTPVMLLTACVTADATCVS